MQGSAPRNQPLSLLAAVALLFGATALVFWGLQSPDTTPVVRAPKQVMPAPRPKVFPLPPPPPEDLDQAALPEREPVPERRHEPMVSTEIQLATESMEDGMAIASDDCIRPMAAEGSLASGSEMVLHLVYADGVVSDIQLRSIDDLPPALIDCMADALWQVEWPQFPGASGESRLQRVIRTP